MASSGRKYDIVLFGATGYTGKYAWEHIVEHFPTNLSWAVSGRSEKKLSDLLQEMKGLNKDRTDPAIEVCQLHSVELNELASKTTILLNCVGPYCLYGEAVVKACAENGTHYFDVTGETPYVYDMIQKYHKAAQSSGAIIIPQIGLESAPCDMLAFALATHLRKTASSSTREVIVTAHSGKGSLSGGTFNTIFNILNVYSLSQLRVSGMPGSMSSVPISKPPIKASSITGVRVVPGLGTLTTGLTSKADVPIVYRSWSLLSQTTESYGKTFSFSAYMTTRNVFTGFLTHIALSILPVFLLIPPLRWALSKLVYQPGFGPTKEETQNDYLELRAIGIPDDPSLKKVHGTFYWNSSAYHLTGVTITEAARTILEDDGIMAKKLGGGVLTPATLGQAYIDRLVKAGVRLDVKTLNH